MKKLLSLLICLSFFMQAQAGVKIKKNRSAKTSKKSSKSSRTSSSGGTVSIPVNIGIGPAANVFYGPLTGSQDYMTGIALDIYAVISKDIIQANKNRIPQQYRGLANNTEEVQLRPGPLALLPLSLIISPSMGDDMPSTAYGASWSLFGIRIPVLGASAFQLSGFLKAPTLTLSYIDSPDLQKDTFLWGLGATPGADLTIKASESFLLSFRYSHNLYLPLGGTEITTSSGEKEDLIQHGTAAVLFNFRIPTQQKL